MSGRQRYIPVTITKESLSGPKLETSLPIGNLQFWRCAILLYSTTAYGGSIFSHLTQRLLEIEQTCD